MSLRQIIEQEIREMGPIPFSRYMELCLYHPELGYYSKNAEQFGKAGDFYTSSDVHAVFGRLLARQFEEMWRLLDSQEGIEILELGPGRGLFAGDVLDWSEKKFPHFFEALHYSMSERSSALRERLQQNLKRHLESRKASIFSSEHTHQEDDSPPRIVFANEFFDALPVEVLSGEGALRISVENGRFVETWAPPSAEELKFIDDYSVKPEADERVEVPLLAQRVMADLSRALTRGFLIVIDYGYVREEQLAGRHRGTVTSFRQHSVSGSPYEAPGEQDITAHVNFTALSAVAKASEMNTHPLVTQSQFLFGIGEENQFADAFEECHVPQERAKVALQLKHLITPEGMGESFQVLVASRGVPPEKVAGLSGLSFGKALRTL